MSNFFSLIFGCISICTILLFPSCSFPKKEKVPATEEIAALYTEGSFDEALQIIKELKNNQPTEDTYRFVDSIEDYIDRYQKEYPHKRAQITSMLASKGLKADAEDLNQWEQNRQLEYKLINGEKRYFKSAIRNLMLLNDSLRNISGAAGLNEASLNDFCLSHTHEIIEATQNTLPGALVQPIHFHLHYSTSLPKNSIPANQNVSMWMPYGHRNSTRQQNMQLHNPGKALISPNEMAHQSVWFSKITTQNEPTSFDVSFSFSSFAQYYSPEILKNIPFASIPDSVLPYLQEREPHIIFSQNIRNLADELTTPEMTPYQMVRSFYYWINDNIPWASAVEYGLIKNIPEYTLDHMHGDCGMQTLLFMALCRYKEIPARWQSGWMLHPDHVNLHDWCEVWYDGIGWVPVDVSFKLQQTEDQDVKEFYISGIDAYRLIVNTDYGRELYPGKKYPRSEPWDFQRGEMEWQEGNLYFDVWERNMRVKYGKY